MAGRRRLDGETVPQPDDVSMNASPKIKQTKLEKIRPTQVSVGLVEVAKKRRAWAQVAKRDRIAFLLDHAFPAVLGPGDRYFATDRHHLGRALLDEKVDSVFVSEAGDFPPLALDEFWVVMDHLQWAHPYDVSACGSPSTRCRANCPNSRTILVAAWPRRFVAQVAVPRTRRPSRSSSGPISCAAACRRSC